MSLPYKDEWAYSDVNALMTESVYAYLKYKWNLAPIFIQWFDQHHGTFLGDLKKATFLELIAIAALFVSPKDLAQWGIATPTQVIAQAIHDKATNAIRELAKTRSESIFVEYE